MRAMILFLLLVLGFTSYAEIIVPADIVEGQDSQKNFLGRVSHFEKNANGVVAYADAAASRPVDGTGGTPSLTCTRTTTTPIEGDGSLLITKGAVNDQGEGCAIAFTIPNNQKAKVLQIEMDYIVASGTFSAGSTTADSDLIVYIYDVTNSTLIEPSSIKFLSNSTTISDKFVANFQTSATGTSYRLILHQATTSASAYTVEFDNLQVKPSRYVYGTPITDWVSYTPTGTWVSGTSTYTGRWRRVGDMGEYEVRISQSGAPTSTGLNINLPSGQTIDTTKIFTGPSAIIGMGEARDTGTEGYPLAVQYVSTTSVIVSAIDAASTYTRIGNYTVNASIPFTWGSGDTLQVRWSVPISGWSSSSQVSDGYDGRDISFIARGTPTGTLNTGYNKVTFAAGTVQSDTVAGFSGGTYTIRSSGKYDISYNQRMDWATGVVNGDSGVAIYINGANVSEQFVKTGATGVLQAMPIVTLIGRQLNASDTVEFYSYNSNTTPTFNTGTISVARRQSPTTISATEVVAAGYRMGTAQSLNTAATVKFDTKDVDTHNMFNSTTGQFTIPVSGIYEISFQFFSVNTATESGFTFRKNNSGIVRTQPLPIKSGASGQAANQELHHLVPYLFSANAGDLVDVYVSTLAASATIYNVTSDNWVSLKRIK